jgi:hypothetical protein
MTPRLRRYLELERLMLLLDEEGDPAADVLRDAMDPLGIRIFDDFDGLHIGENTFSGNVVRQAAVAINLGD